MGGVSTRDFGAREDAAVTDLETGGSSADTHTLMALTKGMVSRLGEIVDAVDSGPVNTLVTGQVVLAATSKLILAANANRRFAEVKNADASISMYIGDSSGVSAANGHLLKAAESFVFSGYTGAVWAIPASGTPTITAMEW